MRANISASDFNSEIYGTYYKKQIGSSTTTTKTMYDENGAITDDSSLAKTVKYTVEVDKRRSTPSYSNLNLLVDPANTSQLSLVNPTDLGG